MSGRKRHLVVDTLGLVMADGGYAGKLIDWVADFGHWILQIVKRCDESLTDSSETMIQIAMINLMIHRLKPG